MLQGLNRLFGKNREHVSDARKVGSLYGVIMTQARTPALFQEYGVPDEFENRFELLTLHMFLVLTRLKREGRAGHDLSRLLTEYMVSDLDRTCREMGIGDVGVVKRMKGFMSGFYGRLLAYEKAAASEDPKDILRALDKNLFANISTDIPKLEAMRAYIAKQTAHLDAQSFAALQKGEISFSLVG